MEMKSLIDLQVILNGEIEKINVDYKYKKEVINYLTKNFAKKGISVNIIQQAFNDVRVIATLNTEQLLPFAYFLEKKLKEIKPNDEDDTENKEIDLGWTTEQFFYPKAIEELEDMELDTEQYEDNLVIFDNVTYDEECNEYLCYISLYHIHDLNERKMVNYNFETQRDPLYKQTSTGISYRVPNVNERAVEDIKLMMINNSFTSNTIVYNIRNTGSIPQVDYREDIRQLSIKLNFEKGSERETWLDVIDGEHRSRAATKAVNFAKKDGRKLTDKLVLIIKNLTEEQAQDFINREEKGKRLATEYTTMLKKTDDSVRFASALSTYGGNSKSNPYYNSIANDLNEITFYNKRILGKNIQKTMGYINAEKIVGNHFKTQKFIKSLANKSKLFYDYVKSEIYNDDEKEFNESIFSDDNILLLLIPAVFKHESIDDVQFSIAFYEYIKNNQEYFKKEFSQGQGRIAVKRIVTKTIQEFNI